MNTLRVIQWTTGKVGKLSLRGILDDPRLELVGVFAYSADKAGTDAGSLCGRPATGVLATTDVDELIALGADTVLYTPFLADLDHVVRLLESGLDVISTNLFLNVGGIQGDTAERLATACRQGNSSLYVTGINPGWINTVVTALTAVCRDVQKISIVESADVSVYESAETWQALGMGLPEATPEVADLAKFGFGTFADSVQRMAVAMGYEVDEMEFVIDHQTTSERVDLGWFCMEKDTIAAIRGGWNAKVRGHTVIESRVAWYLTKKLNGDWVFDDDHYNVVITGEPDVHTRIRFIPPEHWGNHEWDTMTAMPAVSAALDVARAPAGILTLGDVGLPRAPAGLWRSNRAGTTAS